MKKILIGYDEGEASKRALERGAQLAKAFDSQLIVTSVAPITTNIGRSAGPIDSTDPPEAHIEELKHAQTYLEGVGLSAELVPAIGHPAETIAQAAEEHGADLVILGTHEPGLIARLFGQSVSESVAHRVHCDVMFVH
ncbi:MAG TPA: universal stress protein [Solirubrobacteraceae bacterium]|nr:universal stress protein [Solirubrobacteraceae bacterium]